MPFQLSGRGIFVNSAATGVMVLYFFLAVGGYALHGWRRDTDNQFRDPSLGRRVAMASLIVAELTGWLVLLAGFLTKQII